MDLMIDLIRMVVVLGVIFLLMTYAGTLVANWRQRRYGTTADPYGRGEYGTGYEDGKGPMSGDEYNLKASTYHIKGAPLGGLPEEPEPKEPDNE